MKLFKNQQGIAHYLVMVVVVIGVAVGGTAYLVASHADSINPFACAGTPTLTTGSKSTCVKNLQWNLNHLNIAPGSYGVTIDGIYGTKTNSAVNSFKVSVKIGGAGSVGPTTWAQLRAHQTANPVIAPAATPLSTLTKIITNINANVGTNYTTLKKVTVPGPITDGTAQPLVFTLNGQMYFAYTQTTPPNFNTTAATTAASMAIVKATVSNPALETVHIDKSGNLVDEYLVKVGYSTGGSSTGR
ncbi:MAG: hypothetical protein JWN38_1010 [Candidatus Saccharibacteria bacterium]|nr:hypothetical protein [Candidatus Saccharibacteria bacterium]